MANSPVNFQQLFEEVQTENQALIKALISVVLSVGGSVEVSDAVVASITSTDRVITEKDPVRQTHHVWIEREGGVKH